MSGSWLNVSTPLPCTLHVPSTITDNVHTHNYLHTQDSIEYYEAISPCHQRAADRIVSGALANRGLYIKLGQGLGSFNQILPREYIETLRILQDQVSTYISLW